MRTPIKYGKRRRTNSSQPELLWDPAIDTVTRSTDDHSAGMIKRSPPPRARIVESEESWTNLSFAAEKSSVPPRSSTRAVDIFDFDATESNKSKKTHTRSSPRKLAAQSKTSTKFHDTELEHVSDPNIKKVTHEKANGKLRSLTSKQVTTAERSPHQRPLRANAKGKEREVIETDEPNISTDGMLAPDLSPVNSFEVDLWKAIDLSKSNVVAASAGEPSGLGKANAADMQQNKRTTNAERNTDVETAVKQDFLGQSSSDTATKPEESQEQIQEHVDEIDLEPPIRPHTPSVLAPPSSKFLPQISPEQKSMFDILDDRPNLRKEGIRPRRLLDALGKSRLTRTFKVAESDSAFDDERALQSLVETAEINLSQQTQRQDEDEDEGILLNIQNSYSTEETYGSPRTRGKLTYAKQRSFLAESEDLRLDIAVHLQQLQKSSDIEEDSGAVAKETIGIRNVHDLRQGGENKRFVDEVSYLLEGMESEETIQSTLIELARKIASNDFARRFKAAGFQMKVFESARKVHNPVSLFAAIIIITIVLQGPDSTILPRYSVEILRHGLLHSKDISVYIKDKSTKVSKINRLSAQELRSEVAQTEAFKHFKTDCRLSPRVLALMCANMLAQDGVDIDPLGPYIMPIIQEYVANPLTLLVEVRLIFGTMESFRSNTLEATEQSQVQEISAICVSLMQAAREVDHYSPTVCSILRVLIKLANVQTASAIVIVQERNLSVMFDYVDRSMQEDDGVLCLGLLIFLAEESQEARESMKKIWHSRCLTSVAEALYSKRTLPDATFGYYALLLYYIHGEKLDPEAHSAMHSGIERLRKAISHTDGAELQTKLAECLRHLNDLT